MLAMVNTPPATVAWVQFIELKYEIYRKRGSAESSMKVTNGMATAPFAVPGTLS